MDQEPVVSQQNTATKPQTPLPASPKAEKIKKAVAKMGVGHKITAVLANGKEYHGVISGIAEENFQIAEVDLKGTLTVNYHETQKVHQNYFHKDPIFGRKYKTQVILLATIIPAIVVGFIYGFAHRGQ